MTIKVIERNTEERKQDTIELFNKVKPYLDEGLALTTAVKKVLNINYNSFCNRTWFKELMEYATTQGYQKRR